jgi:hypothetical protein
MQDEYLADQGMRQRLLLGVVIRHRLRASGSGLAETEAWSKA